MNSVVLITLYNLHLFILNDIYAYVYNQAKLTLEYFYLCFIQGKNESPGYKHAFNLSLNWWTFNQNVLI